MQHPVHLHGHAFSVVRSAGNTSYNFVDPVVRDVVSTGNLGDNVTIRFFTDNPGPWFFHCHIDWHLNMSVVLLSCISHITCADGSHYSGFAVVFAEDVPDVSTQDFTTGKIFSFSLLVMMIYGSWKMLGSNSAPLIKCLSIPRDTHNCSFLDFKGPSYEIMTRHADNENHAFFVIYHEIRTV